MVRGFGDKGNNLSIELSFADGAAGDAQSWVIKKSKFETGNVKVFFLTMLCE